MSIKAVLFVVLLTGVAGHAYAHDDLDIGIEAIHFDTQCKLNIVVKNYGYELPISFYQTVNPAFLTIKKGEDEETLKSLRALDKKQTLKPSGGTLTIISQKIYANNPTPMQVATRFAEEFGDYGAGNNKRLEAMDCIVGKGQIAGQAIIATQPDVAIGNAFIDPKSCLLSLELVNKTEIALDAGAWDLDGGVGIMRINLNNHHQSEEIALATLDPQKNFTHAHQKLQWQSKLPFDNATNMKVSVWRVKGDLDFSNNNIELAVPNNCSKNP